MGRGALIVFEGLDRCGKSTQCRKLVEALNHDKIPCEFQPYPDRSTAIGKVISKYLTKEKELEDHAVHLLFTANRWETMPQVQKLLDTGVTVVVDRYSYSGVVYTAAKKGFSMNWCKQPEIGLLKPDMVLFLYTDAATLASRSDFGTERYENESFQKKVLENYLKLRDETWKEIDAGKTVEEIHSEIFGLVRPLIKSVAGLPVGRLWVPNSPLNDKTNIPPSESF